MTKSDEWYTPPEILEFAAYMCGGPFTVDPCPRANLDGAQQGGSGDPWRAIVGPYFEGCKPEIEWRNGETADRVWLNPPYSKPLPWAEFVESRAIDHDRAEWDSLKRDHDCGAPVSTRVRPMPPTAVLTRIDPSTKWWAALERASQLASHAALYMLSNRVRFLRPGDDGSPVRGKAPSFPVVLWVLNGEPTAWYDWCGAYGPNLNETHHDGPNTAISRWELQEGIDGRSRAEYEEELDAR